MAHNSSGTTVLLFSGGRDSTLAAVRLTPSSPRLILVTVTSDHLVGIDVVQARLNELAPRLPCGSEWVHIIRNPFAPGLADTSCLPCHHLYVCTGARLALDVGAPYIALGYALYQSAWPEQTPQAIEVLSDVLWARGLALRLPVYDVASREEAEAELLQHDLTSRALEQKCLRQINNREMSPATLAAQLSIWRSQLIEGLQTVEPLRIAQRITLR